MTKSRHINKPREVWSQEQIALLHEHYPHKRTDAIVSIIGKSVYAIYNKVAALGLKKTPEYLVSPETCRLRRGHDHPGKSTQFKKGLIPHNKGVKGITYPGCVATQFKKGVRQGVAIKLYQPIGAERISKDGYLQRKINDDMPPQKRWRGVHIIVWEEVNGPLPKGHAVTFRDGDKKNITYTNLELVSRADLMKRNTIHNYPKEIAQLVQLRGAVQRKINRRLKDEQRATTAE